MGGMQSQTFSSTLIGVEAHLIGVEVVISNGLPGLTVVGLPGAAVTEAGARVRSALKQSGVCLPPRRTVVNLSPADLRKSGSGFDLALALGLLEALEQIPQGALARTLVVGELSLLGAVRPVRGVVSSLALAASEPTIDRIILPCDQLPTLPNWDGVEVVGVANLSEAKEILNGLKEPTTVGRAPLEVAPIKQNLSDVQGQELAKLALEVTAAGGHHLALIGPPGCGKSLLASCLPGLLPPLSEAEQRQVATIASVCQEDVLRLSRPFRAPGVGVSAPALLGGTQPGEVTRAHLGVLFLDEFPEFRRDTLESLRSVLEEGEVRISRARFRTCYPAEFSLVCAMNPCPCGMSGLPDSICTCSTRLIGRYRSKLSGPLRDRIDLSVALRRVELSEFRDGYSAESSEVVARRVEEARHLQMGRGFLNKDLKGKLLMEVLGWKAADRQFATAVAEKENSSMRSFEKWLRVARTIADLEKEKAVTRRHLLTARSIRCFGESELSLVG